MSEHDCRDRRARDEWGVMQCECGLLRVKLGAVVLELDPEDMLRLIDMLDRAVDHFALSPKPAVEGSLAH